MKWIVNHLIIVKLFKRIKRGHYIINPLLKVRSGDEWLSIHDVLRLQDLGFTPLSLKIDPATKNRYLKYNRNYFNQADKYSQDALEHFQGKVERSLQKAVGCRTLENSRGQII